jgi:hypothetical protein
MKVEDVFSNENELRNALLHHSFNNLAFQKHDIVVEQIIPFADELDNGKPVFIMAIQHLHEQRLAAETIPLRMDVVVVNLGRKFELGILTLEER